MIKKILPILVFLSLFCSSVFSNSLHHILYFENSYIQGSSFQDFAIYDSSNMSVELNSNFGGFDLSILNGKIDYRSKIWGLSFDYIQSGQTDLEMYGDEPTVDPIGEFGVYSKLYSLGGYYRPIDFITVYANSKIRSYSVIDYSETEYFGSFYVGTESFKNTLKYRVFAGVWNYTPNNRSVANLFAEANYKLTNFTPKLSTDFKYYSLSEELEVELRASVKAYELISLYLGSQVTGNNIFSTGLAVDYKRYGLSYDLHILKENVDPIHKISVKIPIF